jgi:hypothetical protein
MEIKEVVHSFQAEDRRTGSPGSVRVDPLLTRDRPITHRFPSSFAAYPPAFPARRIQGAGTFHGESSTGAGSWRKRLVRHVSQRYFVLPFAERENGGKKLTHCGAITGRCALKMYFWTLPVAVFGSSDTNWIRWGHLKRAR